ncbi:hypothetical protein LCGC14_2646630 [marine sediment metagenome]|uniref:Uncharacterized protein n=1 Tax=marine sediment metagenome TaxID=412755 RepID=A0A0F8ZW20_9ZZZZ
MKPETLERLKKEAVKILKRGQKSLTEIANMLGRNHYVVQEVLDSLEGDRKIEKITIKRFTFYELK